jgi:hypothetical protein
MITPMEMNDNELLQQFKDCTLSPSFLTHEVLLRITWILIRKNGLERAIVKNCKLKEQYFKEVLKSDKYNNALTIAYAEILHHFMEKSTSRDFDKFLQEFPRLKYSFKDLVKTHYGYNILKEHRKVEPQIIRQILFTF